MLYGGFAPSIQGLLAQSQAMNTISFNVANVNTGGYKKSDTLFSTVLTQKIGNAPQDFNYDFGGVQARNRALVRGQGHLVSSERDLDIALNGAGFFILNSTQDGTGNSLYGRDGMLFMSSGDEGTYTDPDTGKVSNYDEGYLIDKNGYFLQGYALDDSDEPTGSLQSMRIDPYTFTGLSEPTTQATLMLNLPATAGIGTEKRTAYSVYDSDGNLNTVGFMWAKTGTNAWEVTGSLTGGTVTSPASTAITFNGDGSVNTPSELTVTGTTSGGDAISYAMDISGMTQFAGSLQEVFYNYNGSTNSTLERISFDSDGFVMGAFSDTTMRKLYKIPVATFLNPDGLSHYNGNVWAESNSSGSMVERFLDSFGSAQLLPNTLESSNVELQDEFTKMLITQQAYNSSATVFRTVDEMTQVAKDLKR